ncbi:hypothetical protein TIFTF001_026300 [Ficus carica]|uniref:Transmembrane protein n=1 Tax=Ficus carica TaxID=3494 RepID=A0AA88DKZ1_FICCA|nr:hypothetical protein TIFTF001_026300 [Ficus carica]
MEVVVESWAPLKVLAGWELRRREAHEQGKLKESSSIIAIAIEVLDLAVLFVVVMRHTISSRTRGDGYKEASSSSIHHQRRNECP